MRFYLYGDPKAGGIMLLLIITAVTSGFTAASLEFPENRVSPILLETLSGEMIVSLENGFIGTSPGFPDLPFLSENVPLENGTRAVAATAENCVWETVYEDIEVRPLPQPAIVSFPVEQKGAVYGASYSINSFWPQEPVSLSGTGYINGKPCAELVISPFRYNPVTLELQRLESADVHIETTASARVLAPQPLQGSSEMMLIITDQSIRAPFDSLALWRREEGIPTEVVTTDEVYATPGSDNPERIRNYIIDRYQTDGITMVLLGGDTNHIPCRFAFPMSYEWSGGREDNMPCDLYYSDLDGNWNLDGDNIWGEVADSVDLWQDVYVGRAPCEDIDEAWTFFNKIKLYETTDPGHLDDTILAGGVLWQVPFTDEAIVKGYIRDNSIPEWFTNTELYRTSGNYNTNSVIEALNQGAGYVNLNDHGWINIVGCLDNDDVDDVNSGSRFFGMMYSIGCWTTAFDSDCIAEHFLNNPHGCGVSYIGNSSYGWGSPGNPLFGYSDRMDREIFKLLFDDPTLSLGELLAEAKDSFIPFGGQENCYRCVLYMVNLLGDPSMHTFRRAPLLPQISCPDLVTEYTSFFPVTVLIPGNYHPDEIMVCIHDDDFSLYQVEELDPSGFTVFQLASPPQGDITVTVTGTDLRRTQLAIPNSPAPLPAVSGVSVTTPEGYTHPAPGTSALITVTLQNIGSELLSGVELSAQLSSGPGTLTQPVVSYGTISQGSSYQGDQPLELTVNENASTGDILDLQLEISSDQGTWNSTLPLLVFAPGIYFSGYSVDDLAGGNGNGFAEPGESFSLLVDAANSGLLLANDVSATISSQEEWLIWNVDSAFVPQIEPETNCIFTFHGEILTSAPDTAYPAVTLSTEASPQWSGQEEFMFIVGEFLSSSDFETGTQNWSHTGDPDQWHLSRQETHSGEWAWWCGDENTGHYLEDMDCSILSPVLILAPDAQLSFWSCFDIDLYGSDGLYVILKDIYAETSDTLDFIGAGGLLGTSGLLSRGNMMWLPRNYDLSMYEAGTSVQVEFSFHTDDSEANLGAFHIDDVTIDGYLPQNGTDPSEFPFIVGLPHPNPSCGTFSVPLNSPLGWWSVQVFNLAGRIVYSAQSDDPFTGDIQVQLEQPSAGVYLLRAATGTGAQVRKTVVTANGQ